MDAVLIDGFEPRDVGSDGRAGFHVLVQVRDWMQARLLVSGPDGCAENGYPERTFHASLSIAWLENFEPRQHRLESLYVLNLCFFARHDSGGSSVAGALARRPHP